MVTLNAYVTVGSFKETTSVYRPSDGNLNVATVASRSWFSVMPSGPMTPGRISEDREGLASRGRSLPQVDLVLLMCPSSRLYGMTAAGLPTLVTNLRGCFAPIVQATLVFHSESQIPQGNLGTIPATCLLKDSSQVILDELLSGFCLYGDLSVRVAFRDQRCDGPLCTRKIGVSLK